MSNALETTVTYRELPVEGYRKLTTGRVPVATPRKEVDLVFTLARTVIDNFASSGTSGLTQTRWRRLLDRLQAIHTNTINSPGLRGKSGFLRRELRRRERLAYTLQQLEAKASVGKAKRRIPEQLWSMKRG